MLRGSQLISKKVVFSPYIVLKMTNHSYKNPCHVRSLNSRVSIWEFLSPHKITKAQAQPIVEKIADRLPSWKADLLTKAGRMILVQYVLTSMLIYILLALELPPCVLKAIDKIRRGFCGRAEKMLEEGTVCLLGQRSQDQSVWEGLASLISKN